MKAIIKKLVLDIGGKEIKLSLDEAKQLKVVLGELFDEKPIGWLPYPTPIIIDRFDPYWNYPYTTWTSGNVQMEFNNQDCSVSLSL